MLCVTILKIKRSTKDGFEKHQMLFFFSSLTTNLFCLAAGVLLVGYTHSGAKLSNLLGGFGNFTNEMRNDVLRIFLPRMAWWSTFLNTYL